MSHRAAEWRDGLIEDVEWMVSTGEWPGRIAQRVGIDARTLARQLQRYQRPDLARVFHPVLRKADAR